MPREPWIKVKIGIRRSGKLAGLPSDSARLGWFYVLVESKVQRRMGAFDSRAHFGEVLGKYGRFLDDYIAAMLVEVAPDLCDDCRRRNVGLKKGQMVVHDYLKEQRDPTVADRVARHRGVQPDDEEADESSEEPPDGNGDVTAQKREGNAGQRDDVTVENAESNNPPRARATTATETETNLSIGRDSSSSVPGAPVEREDLQALLDRGWKRVTIKQRRVLDEVLDRHGDTGPAFAAETIRMTPSDRDPLAAVMDADSRWQAARRARADAEEAAWAKQKAEDKNGAVPEELRSWIDQL